MAALFVTGCLGVSSAEIERGKSLTTAPPQDPGQTLTLEGGYSSIAYRVSSSERIGFTYSLLEADPEAYVAAIAFAIEDATARWVIAHTVAQPSTSPVGFDLDPGEYLLFYSFYTSAPNSAKRDSPALGSLELLKSGNVGELAAFHARVVKGQVSIFDHGVTDEATAPLDTDPWSGSFELRSSHQIEGPGVSYSNVAFVPAIGAGVGRREWFAFDEQTSDTSPIASPVRISNSVNIGTGSGRSEWAFSYRGTYSGPLLAFVHVTIPFDASVFGLTIVERTGLTGLPIQSACSLTDPPAQPAVCSVHAVHTPAHLSE